MTTDGIEKRVRKSDGRVTFYARVRIGGRSRGKTFYRLTDARIWLEHTKVDVRRGNLIPERNRDAETQMTKVFDRFINEFAISHYNKVEYQKVQTYLARWRKEIGHIAIGEVSPSDVARVRDKLLREYISQDKLRQPATVRRYVQILSFVFNIAINDWGYVQHNPVAKIKKPRPSRGRVRFLDEDEIRRMLEACKECSCPYMFPLVVLAISTGARRGEIMNLRWSDIYWEHSVIRLEVTKNGHPRAIPLAGLARELLERMYKQRRSDSDYVFARKDGQKGQYLEKHWRWVKDEAGIEDFRFHDLRHTAASYLAMNGASLVEISAVLGHRTLQMVQRYTHFSQPHTQAIVAKMNQKLFSGFSTRALEVEPQYVVADCSKI